MHPSQNIAVIGLGSMGYGMALSCLAAQHRTYGFDLDAAAALRFAEAGGSAGALADVAGTLDAALIVVLNAEQTEAVLFDAAGGLVPQMRTGAVVISSATVPPDFARQMAARCAAQGVLYLDAPISGGAVKAGQGALTIMASGSAEAFAAARPVLDAIAETVFEIGPDAGAGSAMKSVNQLLAGVQIAAMAEAMTFGLTQGITPKQIMEVIPNCAGSSWMLENRGPHVVAGDYTPRSAVTIWPKDLGIVSGIAAQAGCPVPLTAAALAQYQAACAAGLGDEDDAALTKFYAQSAGQTLPEGQS